MNYIFHNLQARSASADRADYKFPWFTLLVSLLCLPFSLSATGFALGCFDWQLIQSGEYWRLITGHLSHTGAGHLFWDLLAYSLASAYIECRNRSWAVIATVCGILSVDLLLLSPLASVNQYAGLSGMLFAPLCLALTIFGLKHKGLVGWLPLLLCIGKVIWEQFSQTAFLSDSNWPVYTAAHLVGIAGGCLTWVIIAGWGVIKEIALPISQAIKLDQRLSEFKN